jgi:hypothetical protein
VILPSAVIEADFLAEPPSFIESLFSSSSTWRTVRDLIGAGVWSAALLLGLWALRRALRDRVI